MAQISPISTDQVQIVLPPAAAPGLILEEPAPPEATPEQVKASEAVFAQDAESEAVLGLWGMWAGTLTLHAMAVDAAVTAKNEEDEKENDKRKKEDDA